MIHVRSGASGNGSEASPLGSIAAAIDRVNPGGTVLVHDGTYGTINVSKSGSAGAYITIAAAPGASPRLSPGQYDHAAVQIDGVHHVEVRGFEMVGVGRQDDAGVSIRFGSHDVRVVANHVRDFPGNGIEVIEAGGVEILNNRVHGNSRQSKYQTSGISVFTAKGTDEPGWDNVISGNIVYDNTNIVRSFSGDITDGNCIIIDYNKQFGYTGGFLVSNNVCANNGGRGIHVFHSSNVLAINNTLFRNLTHPEINDGELTAVEAQNVTFRNNLVWSTDGANDIHLWQVTGLVADHNLIVGEKRDHSGGANPSIADPQLQNPNVTPDSDDFKPRGGSPVKGAGSTDGSPSVDLRGVARPAPPAVGALE